MHPVKFKYNYSMFKFIFKQPLIYYLNARKLLPAKVTKHQFFSFEILKTQLQLQKFKMLEAVLRMFFKRGVLQWLQLFKLPQQLYERSKIHAEFPHRSNSRDTRKEPPSFSTKNIFVIANEPNKRHFKTHQRMCLQKNRVS